jgi:hypothetical protein
VRDKVFSMLGRVEEETQRLAFISPPGAGAWRPYMPDPTRRKRVDKVNKQLKPRGKVWSRLLPD